MSLQDAHHSRQDIFRSINWALSRALGNVNTSEPQIVANFVWQITRMINNDLSRVFSMHGFHLSASGVFVHHQPLVKCSSFPDGTSASVEIGDLLFVTSYRRADGVQIRNALLLQAKKVHTTHDKPDNRNQHYIYAYWPEFEYVRFSPELNGKLRKVTEPNLYNGTKYLLIGTEGFLRNDLPPIHTAFPNIPHLSFYRNFSGELYNLLFLNAGRSFIYQPKPVNINWVQVITDLLDVTGEMVSRFSSAAGSPGGQRGAYCFLTGDFSNTSIRSNSLSLNESDEPPQVPKDVKETNEPNGSISVINISIEEKTNE